MDSPPCQSIVNYEFGMDFSDDESSSPSKVAPTAHVDRSQTTVTSKSNLLGLFSYESEDEGSYSSSDSYIPCKWNAIDPENVHCDLTASDNKDVKERPDKMAEFNRPEAAEPNESQSQISWTGLEQYETEEESECESLAQQEVQETQTGEKSDVTRHDHTPTLKSEVTDQNILPIDIDDDSELGQKSIDGTPGRQKRRRGYSLPNSEASDRLKSFIAELKLFYTKPVNLQRGTAPISDGTFAKVKERLFCKYSN